MVNRVALGILLFGLMFITIGVTMIYHPLGFIVPGVICMTAGYISLAASRKK